MNKKSLIISLIVLFTILVLMAFSLKPDNVMPDNTPPIVNISEVGDNYGSEIEKLGEIKLKRRAKLKKVLRANSKRFIVRYEYDLQGDTIFVGDNCLLDFRGGCFKNGVIVGQSTKIRFQETPIFSNIIISGSWNVPYLSSKLFKDIENDNVLDQLFNLTDSLIQNKVIIEDGTYNVSVSKHNEGALLPKSNTEIVLKGRISLIPNPFSAYQIISIMGVKDLYLHGDGVIVGDMYTHEYQENSSNEWGHGLVIRGSENVIIDGITIKDCTGDCCSIGAIASYDVNKPVPVGTPSFKVELRNCTFEGSRRQGLTIGFATEVIVDNCEFSGIYRTFKGTEPGAGIDIEPDNVGVKKIERGCDVADITIKNSSFRRLRLGILAWKTEDANDTRNYKGLRIENCTFDDILRNNVFLAGFKDAVVKSCVSRNIRWGIGFSNCINAYEVDCKTVN